MKRTLIAVTALFAILLAACSSDQGDASAEPTADPTVAVTPSAEPSEAAESAGALPSGGTGSDSELADLLPDELNGVARTDVPGLEQMLAPMLEAQNIDATNVDFVFASYGEGTDALVVQAIRVPGMTEAQLQLFAQMMSGQQSEVDTATVTVGGKSVLQMSGAQVPGAAYLYFADGAMFTIVGESEDLATQLLEALP
ncbi:MAG TPA: hypothetical protein VF367_01720 [Candidatus Limnocylindria bacterium]